MISLIKNTPTQQQSVPSPLRPSDTSPIEDHNWRRKGGWLDGFEIFVVESGVHARPAHAARTRTVSPLIATLVALK